MTLHSIIALGGIGFLVYTMTKAQATAPFQISTGTKMTQVPRKPSFSGNWKLDHPIPTNLWGGHPYGWSGFSAASYLLKRN